MNLDVHPDSLRSFGRVWDQAADALPPQAETLAGVSAGADHFGRINQFLTPAVSVFVWQARGLAKECGELMELGAWAVRATARDLEETDAGVARLMGGDIGPVGGTVEDGTGSVWA
ncbi:hypothetical protein [Nocardioides gilvus]|uniref:hypothetical protein n=1 Tax=Nocardioides gilvus TaxID=1735589 RepID=UPI000D74023F|nr:hypothetical protein [Nocardioides gilvus]